MKRKVSQLLKRRWTGFALTATGILVMAACYLSGLYDDDNNWLLALPLLLIIGGAWVYVHNIKGTDKY
ncbi:MAG: hypothetical protein MR661_01095 [Prevotella sp.]|nr:hypothetical protein [Prevotella sp.]